LAFDWVVRSHHCSFLTLEESMTDDLYRATIQAGTTLDPQNS